MRHEEYGDLDPLHALFRLSTQRVDLLRNLPTTLADLDQLDALLIAGGRSKNLEDLDRLLSQIAKGREHCQLPVLLLTSADISSLAGKPAETTICRLPTDIDTIGKFLRALPPVSAGRHRVAVKGLQFLGCFALRQPFVPVTTLAMEFSTIIVKSIFKGSSDAQWSPAETAAGQQEILDVRGPNSSR